MKQKILPSIMAKSQKELDSDFKRLKGIVKELHLDVVDGKFAPNKTLQFKFKLSKSFKYNVHLMVRNPEKWIEKNLKENRSGFKNIDLFIPQIEEIKDVGKYIGWMKSKNKNRNKGKKIAFALKPGTKITKLKPYLKDINCILILTVHPGFYGAKFLKAPLKKIKKIKKINPKIKVIVDGGMCPETIGFASKAGADLFVSGSFTTKAGNPMERIRELTNRISK